MAWILFAIVLFFFFFFLALTLLVIRSSRVWVYYEGERAHERRKGAILYLPLLLAACCLSTPFLFALSPP